MVSRALLLSTDRTPKRALGVVAAAFVAASLLVVLPWEPTGAAGRYPLWAALIAVAVGAAGDAGRRRGGLLVGWGAVFLATVWVFVVPPLAALARGDTLGDGGYAVPRPSVVALRPRAELLTGLRIGPVVALVVALTLGSAAFVAGAAVRRRTDRP
ncbi:hypothetical protein PM076_05515 [Halorubrum ezzemoulense]|uniref:Uncharacterized protein n=2 Tax=Halorubrum ezzemoulense TaxID=337243 RepID=A0A256J8I8_HALEZ|nr:hypothetical protein [Halorubrum ezzemoulense]MDB2245490.1 hypothetical protein [Halorubrum ezzemoulense]MDB2250376.1 hypothetical protein [Halorubrum ezzemoulense]MDB2279132.1 hypothetical protein [Halorubrum ezzemoulense]MDB2285632.1 hypothetical protein [Halorubrum ezzemoulense]MDB2287446.1 hypothetical protein [Halorubrum ezzemoulense]